MLLRPHNRNNQFNRVLALRQTAMVVNRQRNKARHRVNMELPHQRSQRNKARHRVNMELARQHNKALHRANMVPPRQRNSHRNPPQCKTSAFAA